MKFINPSVEIWEQDVTTPDTLVEAMWAHIARCVRVCYQVDKPKNNETEEEYVRRVIFRNPDERLANHYSVLEHGAVYLKVPCDTNIGINERLVGKLWDNKYTKRRLVDENGVSYPNYHYEDLLRVDELYAKSNLVNPSVIVDTNHNNSGKKYLEQIRIAKDVVHSLGINPELRKMVKGLMIVRYTKLEILSDEIERQESMTEEERQAEEAAEALYKHLGVK